MEYLSKEYYRASATYLSPEVFEEIHKSREKVKNAVTTMAKKHHISTRRVYEIWRRCAMGQPDRIQQGEPENRSPSSSTASLCQDDIPQDTIPPGSALVDVNNVSDSKKKKTGGKKPKSKSVTISEPSIVQKLPPVTSSEDLNISRKDLHTFFEKEARRDEKNKAEIRRKLAV
jgi:hypothetical protein